jgi:hypothetical protein
VPRDARALAKSVLPLSAYRAARNVWENLRDWIGVFGLWWSFASKRAALPKVLLYFGFAPGDDLLCTAVLRELRKRGKDGLLMVSDHRELFAATMIRPMSVRCGRAIIETVQPSRSVGGSSGSGGASSRDPNMRRLTARIGARSPPRHIIAEMCARAGITRTGSDQAISRIK